MNARTSNPQRKGPAPRLLLLAAALSSAGATAQAAMVNTKLNGPLAPNGNVLGHSVSPDSQWIVYEANQDSAAAEIYSVPVEGGNPTRLNSPLPADPALEIERYRITPDSRRVIYILPPNTEGVRDLYSVPIQGPAGAGVLLNPPIDATPLLQFEITPDASRVVFPMKDDPDSLSYFGLLFSVPVAGPAASAVQIVDQVEGTTVSVLNVIGITESNRVVFLGHRVGAGPSMQALYSVPADGPPGSAVRITPLLPLNREYFTRISPDGGRVVYTVDQGEVGVYEIFSAPIGGPPTEAVRLNTLLPTGGDVSFLFQISPDSTTVVYSADQTTNDVTELFSVPIGGPALAAVKLNKPLGASGDVIRLAISPDSNWVVYQADQDTDGVFDLYRVPILGPANSGEKLNDTLVAGGEIDLFTISPYDSSVVYLADLEVDEADELYSVPLLGQPTDRVQLNLDLGVNGDVTHFRLSLDGSMVVYRADRIRSFFGDDVFRLWTVPVSGPARANVIHGIPPVAGGDVFVIFFAITPDNHYVVYIADQDTDNVNELYVSYDRPAAARAWIGYK